MDQMYEVVVDGIPWTDADGNEEWTLFEANALAEKIERQGYTDVIVQEV